METLWQDIRYGARQLRKTPGFTAVAVITLALGIGATTAIFSIVAAVLLRPLPYPDASRLMLLHESSEAIPEMSISMANFNDWRAQNTVFESLGAFQGNDAVMSGRGEPERLQMRRITASLFPALGMQPILGRAMLPEEDKIGAEKVVLLGEGFWQRKFGGDRQILGQTLVLDSEPYTVIGVMPGRLHESMRKTDLFTSLWRMEDVQGGEKNRGNHPGIYAYGRLKNGVTLAQAQSQMKQIAQHLDQAYPKDNGKDSVTVQPLLEAVVEDVRSPLLVLLAAVGCVLLIVCVNVANLQLARATERYRELAVRMALGAGRKRLIRQMLTESLMLSLTGGALGLLLAVWLSSLVAHSTTAAVPRLDEVQIDKGVLAFAFVVSAMAGMVFGIIPALRASQTELQDALREDARTSSGAGRKLRLRDALVTVELAMALILLVGAGLMTKSLWKVLQADSGIRPDHVLTARFSLPDATYVDDARRRTFVSAAVASLQSLPGVEAAGFKNPLLGGWQSGYAVEGKPKPNEGEYPSADFSRVTPDAPKAMGMRLLSGRFFDAHDNETGQRVCLVDEAFVKENFGGRGAVGKRIVSGDPKPGEEPKWLTIVGVVAHVKNYGVDQPSRAEVLLPNMQSPGSGGAIVVRTTGDPFTVAGGIAAAVHGVDPSIPVYDVRTLESVLAENTISRRLSAALIASFAGLALLLAGVGVYGVMAYSVSQRNHEIGIRMALGAKPEDVLQMIGRHGLVLAGIGISSGILGAAALTRLMAALLFRVSALDAGTYALGAGALLVIVILASWIPAKRATRIDPIVALRYE
jgi:putative ABC transport system permease protein